ncbi:MAG: metallophosphoesterase [Anaeromyxobacteraceae bacterium]
MRLGHISDLHLSDRGRYPRNGYSPRDCDRHSIRLAQRLLEQLEAAELDHLVVTGDLTLSAEASEFEKAARLLRGWAEAGKLTVVPGNHDLWTADAVKTARFLRMIGPDGLGMRKPVAAYPFAALPVPEVAIVALDSSQFGETPTETPGLIGSAQLQACRELVREHVKEGRAVLLALHHHLMLPRERIPSDVHVARMPLHDADKVVRMVSDVRVAGVLHGHRHCAFRLDIPGAAGLTPVLCAGSATRVADEPARRARGFVYEVDRGGIRSVRTVLASAG